MPELNEEAKKRIASLEKENQNLAKEVGPLYTAIGKNYYEKPEGHEKEIEKAIGRLDTIKKQIHENRVAILAWKGIRLCPNCGSEVEQGAIFCGECGIRMEAVKEVDENSMLCSRCGAKNEKGKKFCTICGQKLVDIVKAVEGNATQSTKWPEGETIEAETVEAEVAKVEPEDVEPELLENVVYLEEAAATREEGSNEANLPVGEEMPQGNVIFCPECGNKLPADALFCGECGTRIEIQQEASASADLPLICPKCGHKLPADALFCEECGTKIETCQEVSAPVDDTPLFCPECGTKLPPGSAFCTECGKPVSTGK